MSRPRNKIKSVKYYEFKLRPLGGTSQEVQYWFYQLKLVTKASYFLTSQNIIFPRLLYVILLPTLF